MRTLASTCSILCICTERSEFFPEAFWLDLAATRIFLVCVTHWKHLESRKENKNVENPGPYSKLKGLGTLRLQNPAVLTYTGTHGMSCRKRPGTTSQNMKETLGHLYLSQLLLSGLLFPWHSAALILVTCASHKGLHHQWLEVWKLSSPIQAPRKEGRPSCLTISQKFPLI